MLNSILLDQRTSMETQSGRVNNIGYNACGEITKLRKVLDAFALKAQIVVPDLLRGMLVHPYSKETVQLFLRDAARAEEMIEKPRLGRG